mmetsp:Transcript_7178/g.15430  ORF Transcript_7178/g.15430 Transcript_7178/m.15430 type:complete len:84 (+) Transcript_7178:65-316(+)
MVAEAKAAMCPEGAAASTAPVTKARAGANASALATMTAGNAVAKANMAAPAQRAKDTSPKKGIVACSAKEQVKGSARCVMATP